MRLAAPRRSFERPRKQQRAARSFGSHAVIAASGALAEPDDDDSSMVRG
jgi:hypothetical protein